MQKHYDKVPTQGSTNPVKSDGLHQQLATIGLNLGNLANLQTTDKSSLVAAVNEVKATQSDSGFPFAARSILIELLKKVAYTDESVGGMIEELEDIILQTDVISIDAVFTQPSEEIYQDQPLDVLKNYLVVTATKTDQSTSVVYDYTLSGELVMGQTCTITASYGGFTDTFNVAVANVYHYREGSQMAIKAALFSDGTQSDSGSYARWKYNGVKQQYVRYSSATTKRAGYPFFDLALPTSGNIRVELYTDNINSSYKYYIGLPFFNAAFQADGLANVGANHNNDISDTGWIEATQASGYYYIDYNLGEQTGVVGTRVSLRVTNGSGTELAFPITSFNKLVIRKLS